MQRPSDSRLLICPRTLSFSLFLPLLALKTTQRLALFEPLCEINLERKVDFFCKVGYFVVSDDNENKSSK